MNCPEGASNVSGYFTVSCKFERDIHIELYQNLLEVHFQSQRDGIVMVDIDGGFLINR